MDVLLTWSGEVSHELATFFHGWLPGVLPGINPWISDEDIAKGQKWFPTLMDQLAKTHVSLTFVTPGNVRSPWIYYEVGVIAAKLETGIVCPYLIGVEDRFVKDTPLGQFQWTKATKDDTWKLIKSINTKLADRRHDEQVLQGNFNTQWTKLKRTIDKLMESMQPVREEVADLESSIEEQLSKEARGILVEASKDTDNRIMSVTSSWGTAVQANRMNMVPDQSPRTVAIWKAALQELVNEGLVNALGYKGHVFELTRKGYDIAELIESRL